MLELWHLWLIAGVLLWILEIFTPGFVAGVFGTACLITAACAWGGVSLPLQFAVFGLATLPLALGVRPLVLKYLVKPTPEVKTNVDALVGLEGLVLEPIDGDAGTGRVKIGGEDWLAVSADQRAIDAGEKVIVVRVEGAKVIVQREKGALKC